jgi:hypothetical protein
MARCCSPQSYSLDDVMQQAGDGLVLVAAIFEDERADPQQAREVGDVRALAKLAIVVERGVVEGDVEAGEAVHGRDLGLRLPSQPSKLSTMLCFATFPPTRSRYSRL